MILISEKMTSQNKLYEIKSLPYNKPLSKGVLAQFKVQFEVGQIVPQIVPVFSCD